MDRAQDTPPACQLSIGGQHLQPAFDDPFRQVPVRLALFAEKQEVLVVRQFIDGYLRPRRRRRQPADRLVFSRVDHEARRMAVALHDHRLMPGQRIVRRRIRM